MRFSLRGLLTFIALSGFWFWANMQMRRCVIGKPVDYYGWPIPMIRLDYITTPDDFEYSSWRALGAGIVANLFVGLVGAWFLRLFFEIYVIKIGKIGRNPVYRVFVAAIAIAGILVNVMAVPFPICIRTAALVPYYESCVNVYGWPMTFYPAIASDGVASSAWWVENNFAPVPVQTVALRVDGMGALVDIACFLGVLFMARRMQNIALSKSILRDSGARC